METRREAQEQTAAKSPNMQTTISKANSNDIAKRIEKEMNKKCTKMIVCL